MTVAKVFIPTNELSDWTRAFAEQTLPICPNPSLDRVKMAIATYLPEKATEIQPVATVEGILEKVLGITVIVQFGRERIGWIATTNPREAENLLQLLSSEPYSQARRELAIDGQWILLVKPQWLDVYGTDELMSSGPYPLEIYEKYPQMYPLEERQECVVVEL